MPNRRPAAVGRLADRLFVGGCTAVYLALVVSALAALGIYGR